MRIKKLFLIMLSVTLLTSCGYRAKTNEAVTTETHAADMAPDFELPDLQGNPLKLSSLRGKYVVLDFWGSWCIWCIRGIPHMKAYYAKYKEKIEILGIDCHDTEEKWKATVMEYDIPWLHVRCDDAVLPYIAQKYKVEGFPTKVIIDPEGRLVKTVAGEDPAFYTFLDELLK